MENFEGGKFRAIPDFQNFAGINSTFHVYNFREKREIKNTSKFSARLKQVSRHAEFLSCSAKNTIMSIENTSENSAKIHLVVCL